MNNPDQVWNHLNNQTQKLLAAALSDDSPQELRDDISTLVDCALMSHLHPQYIVKLIEEEEFDLLREQTYARAH